MPMTQTEFHHAVPVYEYLDGWAEDITGARKLDELPPAARQYVEAVEQMCHAPVSAVGVGPGRNEILAIRALLRASIGRPLQRCPGRRPPQAKPRSNRAQE